MRQPDEEYVEHPSVIMKTSDSFRTILDGVLVLGIAALIGVVWNMGIELATLSAQVKFMSDQIVQIEGKLR